MSNPKNISNWIIFILLGAIPLVIFLLFPDNRIHYISVTLIGGLLFLAILNEEKALLALFSLLLVTGFIYLSTIDIVDERIGVQNELNNLNEEMRSKGINRTWEEILWIYNRLKELELGGIINELEGFTEESELKRIMDELKNKLESEKFSTDEKDKIGGVKTRLENLDREGASIYIGETMTKIKQKMNLDNRLYSKVILLSLLIGIISSFIAFMGSLIPKNDDFKQIISLSAILTFVITVIFIFFELSSNWEVLGKYLAFILPIGSLIVPIISYYLGKLQSTKSLSKENFHLLFSLIVLSFILGFLWGPISFYVPESVDFAIYPIYYFLMVSLWGILASYIFILDSGGWDPKIDFLKEWMKKHETKKIYIDIKYLVTILLIILFILFLILLQLKISS